MVIKPQSKLIEEHVTLLYNHPKITSDCEDMNQKREASTVPPLFSFSVSSFCCCFALALFHIAHLGDHSVSTGSIFIPFYGCIDYRWRRTIVCFTFPLWMVFTLFQTFLLQQAQQQINLYIHHFSCENVCREMTTHGITGGHQQQPQTAFVRTEGVHPPTTSPDHPALTLAIPRVKMVSQCSFTLCFFYDGEGKCLLICLRAINFSFSH